MGIGTILIFQVLTKKNWSFLWLGTQALTLNQDFWFYGRIYFDRKLCSTEHSEIFLTVWLRVLYYCSFPFFVFPHIFRVCVMSPPPPLYCFIHLGLGSQKCSTQQMQLNKNVGEVLINPNPSQFSTQKCMHLDPILVHKLLCVCKNYSKK